MMKRVLLAVDASYQIYRACAANPQLQTVDGVYTGGMYGFLMTFCKAVRETEATHAVIALDSKPYIRSRDYPQYKKLGRNNTSELKERFDLAEPQVHAFMRELGVPLWSEVGFEFDDLIAHTVRRHRGRWARIYAQTNDSDAYQLLDCPTFAIYKDHIRNVVDRKALMHATGLTPEQYMLSTALMGTHNSIEGIRGVGEKTSQKAVKDAALMRKYRDAHSELIERNLSLIRLPHPEFPRHVAVPGRTSRFNPRALYRVCARYEIECTLSMVNAFEQLAGDKQ